MTAQAQPFTTDRIHQLEVDDVLRLLKTGRDGLSSAEVAARLGAFGPNQWQYPSRWRWLLTLVKHLTNFFSLLLVMAAATCFVANWLQPGEGMGMLGWALLTVSLVNSTFAFVQETRAERAMEELQKFLPPSIRVRRGGQESEILADQLVPGDLIIVSEGDRIAADARLLESEELLVNNAPLTGESRSLPVTSDATTGQRLDSPNLVFAGCSVLRGTGMAVVYATGHDTEFGRIAALSRDVQRPETEMDRETRRMIRILTIIAVIMGLLFFAYGVAAGRSLWVNLVFMLGIIVANVPEGLLPTFTLALSMASLRMARKKVLVRGLEAVESLGAVHVICTDKTGTLTRNELALAAMIHPLSGNEITDGSAEQSLLKAALIASEVHGEGPWKGDPLDVLIAERYASAYGSPADIIARTKRHLPFDLQKRREAGVYAHRGEVLFAIKGAWESLRPFIGSFARDSAESPVFATSNHFSARIPVNPERLARCDEHVHRFSSAGKRVIAVAYRRLHAVPAAGTPETALEQSLILLGFLVLEDPLRSEVPHAVAACHRAGIRVVLITGDHPDTAAAIAREAGIFPIPRQDRTANVVEPGNATGAVLLGRELDAMTEEELAARMESGVSVFARTTPDQKLKIVTALQRMDLVVAMTGDGVNDAPALKAADIGIAMGKGGTDVAREAADIVLLDDNFATIVTGVEEGRAVFRNMQKFTTYVLSSNVPEIVPFLLFMLFPIPLALTVVQILSIDLGTDLLPAIGLGQEPPESDEMEHPPRPNHQRLLSGSLMISAYLFLGVVQAAWSMALFFLVLFQGGWVWGTELSARDPLYQSATGMTLSAVILMQVANVIGRRSIHGSGFDRGLAKNPLILAGVFVEILFSWAVLYWSPLQQFLGTGPVSWSHYLLAWLGIPLLFGLDLLRKRIRNRRA